MIDAPGQSALAVSPARLIEPAQIAPLFEHCFNQPFDESLWRWKYLGERNPSVVLMRGEQVVGHYGGMPRTVFFCGARVAGIQIGDVMVHASVRSLGRRNAFREMVATFLDAEVGFDRPSLIAFGFPNLRHLRLGEALGLYAGVDRVTELHWPALSSGPELRAVEGQDPGLWLRIDACWRAMQASSGQFLVGERSAERWHRRFASHPSRPYESWWFGSEDAEALVVTRRHEQALEWLDFVGPLDQLAKARDALRTLAGACALPEVFAWLSTSVARRLRSDDARELDIQVGVPTCAHTPGPRAETLRGHWWLMGGDTDFR